ncbi:hypothetical protein I204_02028 [Kwoniella mangroviensis CBS 8886]|uniref:uncharacterized protein n=1 Tax=Kwoniella mangroviensis CBS 8507 TaxID=1296122 RepID=UPI00080D5D2B|nr:uncharacterized protein I203_03666 [Kwoniella mangroviensis CBS 8507]OCF66984.1 hypothetical protein I203_03666 [Kwoniella mangroviensis CBS 8507]OCF78022.1 hypothetical protein I204_02028 [Kwoniella mangroviensis CBS 8886]
MSKHTDANGYEDTTVLDGEKVAIPEAYREPPKANWKGRIWDTFDAPPEERKLLFKLDAVLLLFGCLGWFIKNLDQENLATAFVSGMKEDLDMLQNQYTTALTMWTVGYCLGQIPSNMILLHVSPRYWIPALELVWGLCTLLTYRVSNHKQLYALRFFVGLAESGMYPALHWILGSYYKPNELAKRASLLGTSAGLGALFSSILQAAAYTNLDGRHGLAGWRWLFIIDAVITLPVALLGLVFLPAVPGHAQEKPSFWLSQADLDLARSRMASVGRAPQKPLTWKRVLGYSKTWHFYLLPFMYMVWNNSIKYTAIMPFWLKDKGNPVQRGVAERNHLVMPITGIGIVTGWIAGWASDGLLKGKRWPIIALYNSVVLVTAIALAVLPLWKNLGGHFALYYLSGAGTNIAGLYFAWINEICGTDAEKRALILAMSNDASFVLQSIVPNFVWKQVDYPKATKGLWYTAGLSIFLMFIIATVRYLHNRDKVLAIRAANVDKDQELESPGVYENYDDLDAKR